MLGKLIGVKKYPEFILLMMLLLLLVVIGFLLDNAPVGDDLLIITDTMRVENGRIVPYTDAELVELMRQKDAESGSSLLRAVFAAELIAIVAGIAGGAYLAIRRQRPIIIWIAIGLLGNIGAIAWLMWNAPKRSLALR